MKLFLIAFPLVAILSVPLIAWIALRAASREASAGGRALTINRGGMRRLVGTAVVLCCAFLAVRAVVPESAVPPNVLALLVALGAFHGLWWGMAAPLVREQDAALNALRTGAPPDGRRRASLRQRDARDYLPASLLPLPLVIAALGCGALVWRLMSGPTPCAGVAGAAVLAALAAGELVLYRWWLHAEVRAPQNLLGTDPEFVEREWDALRRFRVRIVFFMHCVMPAVFLVFSVLFLESSRGAISGATVGIAGGVVGTVVGLAGAAFGIMAGVRRRRLDVRRSVS